MIGVDSIFKYYEQQTILHDVSFQVQEGEILGLLGPNGAGKTTLMRIVNRIVAADKGHVTFGGELLKEKHLLSIGYLPEERGLYQSMTVEKHILYLAQLRGLSIVDAKYQLNYWLDKFEIQDWRKKRIEELSKGMAQKIQFICTVLHNPKVLILDEPFSGFDPMNVELIRQELLDLKEKGHSIILSTHNMNSVEEICDRAVLINKGQKILEGEVQALREQYNEGVFQVRFQGNMLAFTNALWVGYEIIDKKDHANDVFSVYIKMRHGNEVNDLLNAVIEHVKILSVDAVLPTMEKVFVKTINEQIATEYE